MSKILGKHFGNPKISLSECSLAQQLGGAWQALGVQMGRQSGCPAELPVVCSIRGRRCQSLLHSRYPGPSPAFPGQSISHTLLYPIPAAPFPAPPAPPTIPALNSACLVPPLRGRGRCQPEPAPRTPRNAWAVSGTALPPPPVVQLGLSGCHLQPPWLAAPGKLVPVPAAGGGARRLCSLPLAGAGSAGRAGNSPG